MAETLHLIDVFIGQIDAAGEAHLAIDDTDLAVVAVIKAGIHAGAHGVIRNSLDIEAGQFLGIAGGKPLNAAEVIVDDADLHPAAARSRRISRTESHIRPFSRMKYSRKMNFLALGSSRISWRKKSSPRGAYSTWVPP